MSPRFICWIVFSLVAGFLIGAVVTDDPEYVPLEEQSVAYHWKRVREYREYINNPYNYRRESGSGLSSTTVPFDIQPHLAFLDSKGELEHLDIVLPTVSKNCRPAMQYWMKFVNEHDEVIEASGGASNAEIQISGERVFQFHVWIDPDFRDEINNLIQELEEIAKKECGGVSRLNN
ncbi:hypothetical protein OAF42_02270 [Planctomicrobium sp.]|nr:hypothetical protein [Planctomicrobium sp.]MBT5020240.1 hypothetical protein [Planctomicrobium sp.]MDB4731361.1 hypothetical protein [bacterium]MDB4733247.1 hypothetical protein [Planctomicrobium sp.]